MTTATTTLADWLLERLAEDEAVARAAVSRGTLLPYAVDEQGLSGPADMGAGYTGISIDPARVLREVAAKRALVERAAKPVMRTPEPRVFNDGAFSTQEATYWHEPTDPETLLTLAQVYAGAPGWREEWAL